VHCAGEEGLSLVLALVGRASAAGSWCGLVGVDDLGVPAAADYGVDLCRLAVLRGTGAGWPPVAGHLIDGFDIVVVQPPGRARPAAARQLAARARQRHSVLLVLGEPRCWTGPADVRLAVGDARWHGLDRGAGRLRARRVTVMSHCHGVSGRPVERELWLPTATGSVAAA
jgi:hypothetical protein